MITHREAGDLRDRENASGMPSNYGLPADSITPPPTP
jgi:hypothetical protein